jgi:hypothetical protein
MGWSSTTKSLTSLKSRDLAVEVGLDIDLDVGDQPLDLVGADRPFVTSFLDAEADLLAVERDPRTILFDDLQRRFFDFLPRRKPPVAAQALPAAADLKFLAAAGVDDLGLALAAEGTFHVSGQQSAVRCQ